MTNHCYIQPSKYTVNLISSHYENDNIITSQIYNIVLNLPLYLRRLSILLHLHDTKGKRMLFRKSKQIDQEESNQKTNFLINTD
jgi:hypothetical protein